MMQLRVQLITSLSMAALLLAYQIIPWYSQLTMFCIFTVILLALAAIMTMLRRWGYR